MKDFETWLYTPSRRANTAPVEEEPVYQEVGRAEKIYTLYSTLPRTSAVTNKKNLPKRDLSVQPVDTKTRDLFPREMGIFLASLLAKYPELDYIEVHNSSSARESQYIFQDKKRGIRVVYTEQEIELKVRATGPCVSGGYGHKIPSTED